MSRNGVKLLGAGASLTLLVLFGAAALAGCVSKSTAEAEQRAAFLAGQNETLLRMQQARQTNVTIIGQVKQPVQPWTQGLTLAAAIVGAQYTGQNEPTSIAIRRNGQEISVDPKKLLNGQDVPLQPGDIVELRQ